MKTANKLIVLSILFFSASFSIAQEVAIADVVIANAKVTTLNNENSNAQAIGIKGKKIIAVGNNDALKKHIGKYTKVIDAQGKRVIPGLIDSHIHFIRQGNMPGFMVQNAENVTSISDMLFLLKQESKSAKQNQFVTVMGGFVTKQLKENRLPTIEELDKTIPNHPVFVQVGFDGPSVTNSEGAKLFKENGLKVNSNGIFEKGQASTKAFKVLQKFQTTQSKQANLKRLMEYANSVGLTGIHDQGGTNFPNSSAFNTFDDYQALLDNEKNGDLTIRTRIQHVIYDKDSTDNLLEQKINNTFQGFGSEMLKYWTVGEHIVSFPRDGKVNNMYQNKAMKAAKDGWTHEQHSVSFDENKQHLEAIKKVNATNSVENLRWALSHVFELGAKETDHLIVDLMSLKMGLKVQNHGYYTVTDKFPLGRSLKGNNSGPLFKILLSQNIPLGGGTDGPLLGPMNPWFSLYYMVSGKDVSGKMANPNETISRLDALKIYTLGSAWFSFDENKVGTIEVGKFADIVILDSDYFSIDEDDIKNIKADLTIVNGKIVYESKN